MKEKYIGRKFKTVFLSKETNIPANKRKELLRCGRTFSEMGLGPFLSGNWAGNLSFRLGKKIVITAGGANLGKLEKDDLVEVIDCDVDNKIVKVIGKKEPSSETMLHWFIYKKRPEVNAVLHGHDKGVMKKAEKLNLPITEKEQPYGTLELAMEVLKILDDHDYIILKNAGILSLGKNVEEALDQAVELHQLSKKTRS
ncbi:MAG: class II aldolase/adducin family protein [Candidatus Aenigmarchaeota archaeon]|nr:class II aldolase/adducin family protein [Candidatus Aenigmarchaeota archaeon]